MRNIFKSVSIFILTAASISSHAQNYDVCRVGANDGPDICSIYGYDSCVATTASGVASKYETFFNRYILDRNPQINWLTVSSSLDGSMLQTVSQPEGYIDTDRYGFKVADYTVVGVNFIDAPQILKSQNSIFCQKCIPGTQVSKYSTADRLMCEPIRYDRCELTPGGSPNIVIPKGIPEFESWEGQERTWAEILDLCKSDDRPFDGLCRRKLSDSDAPSSGIEPNSSVEQFQIAYAKAIIQNQPFCNIAGKFSQLSILLDSADAIQQTNTDAINGVVHDLFPVTWHFDGYTCGVRSPTASISAPAQQSTKPLADCQKCLDGYVKVVPNGATELFQCEPVDDESDDDRSCHSGNPYVADPIYPLTGEERFSIIYGNGETVSYSNINGLLPERVDRVRVSSGGGEYWSNSLSRSMKIQPDGKSAYVKWSDGRVKVFVNSGSAWSSGDPMFSMRQLSDGAYLVTSSTGEGTVYASNGALQSIFSSIGPHRTAKYGASSVSAFGIPAPDLLVDQFNRPTLIRYQQLSQSDYGISTVTDPIGFVTAFEYDSLGKIRRVGWPDGTSQTYTYEKASTPWALTGRIDENNIRYASIQYDSIGRATGSNFANLTGHTIIYQAPPNYSIAAQRGSDGRLKRIVNISNPTGISIKDPNGAVTTMESKVVLKSNIGGKPYLTSKGQSAGSGCSASTSTQDYDERGNTLWSDDFNGHRTCYAYSTASSTSVGNLEVTRVEGLTGIAGANAGATVTDCSAVVGNSVSLSTLFPGRNDVRKISTAWHPQWVLQTQQAEPKLLTTWVYNGQPDPFSGNQLASCVSNTYGGSATLPDGSPIAVLCKKVEQATADTDGSQGLNATLDNDPGHTWQRVDTYTYTEYGQVLTHTDATGQTTTYSYYTDGPVFSGTAPNEIGHYSGDLKSVSNALGHTTTYDSYDRVGRVLQSTDPNKLVTKYSYTPRGWVSTTTVGTLSTSYDYWPTGLLKKVSQPDGSALYYQWDDAHRLTDVSDRVDASGAPAGNWVHYTLDNAGNRKSEDIKDTSGALVRKIARNFDALNRLQNVSGAQR